MFKIENKKKVKGFDIWTYTSLGERGGLGSESKDERDSGFEGGHGSPPLCRCGGVGDDRDRSFIRVSLSGI